MDVEEIGGLRSLKAANKTPLKDYRVLYNELKLYKDGMLLDKPSLIAVNKVDLHDNSEFHSFYEDLKREAHAPVIPISAKEGENLELLVETLKDMVDAEKEAEKM